MAYALQRFTVGDGSYITKHNQNATTIEGALNLFETALGSVSGVISVSNLYKSLFGAVTRRIDESGVVGSIVGGTVQLTTGYVWLPNLGSVVWVGAGSTTAADLTAYADNTYYISVDVSGNATITTTSGGDALYSVVKSGGALGSLTPILDEAFTLANPLTASHGGTGRETLTSGAALTGNGTGTVNMISGTGGGQWFRWSGTAWGASTTTFPNSGTANRLLYCSSTNNFSELLSANNGTLVTGNTGIPSILAGPGVAGRLLSSNSGAAPSWLATANNGVLVTDGSGVASIGSTLPTAVQDNITRVGTITSGTWQGGVIASAYLSTSITSLGTVTSGVWNATAIGATYGGTGQTAVTTGDLLYGSAANTWGRLAGVATGNVLLSGGVATAPAWGAITNAHVDGSAAIALSKLATTGTITADTHAINSGGALNFNGGDVTVTHSANDLEIEGGTLTIDTNWIRGALGASWTINMLRPSYYGYSGTYEAIQVGGTGVGLALLVDPTAITGGNFTGTAEILLPNTIDFIQANSGGTDWGAISAGVPMFRCVNGLVGVNVAGTPAATLDVGDRTISGTSGIGFITRAPSKVVSASGTNYLIGFDARCYSAAIASGQTDSGYRVGCRLDGYVNDAAFEGTLTDQYGAYVRAGISVAGGAGARTVTNSYALYVETLTSAGTVTNAWGVYQVGGTKNYFAGSMKIDGLLDISAVAAGSARMKITATSDTPTATWGAAAGNEVSAAPAGWLEIDVGGASRYIPFWA